MSDRNPAAGRPPVYGPADIAEWKKLLDQGWTFRKVAEHHGVNEATVKRRVGAIGRRTGPRAQPITVEQAATAYARTGSLRAAAQELGVSVSVVRRRLRPVDRDVDTSSSDV